MRSKVLLGAVLVAAILAGGLTLAVRSVLGSSDARDSIAAELSRLAGRPVHAGSVTASAFPGPHLVLHDVSVGTEPPVHVASIDLGLRWLAVLTRRLDAQAVTAVHVADAEMSVRGRTLRASGDLVPGDRGAATIREATITADEMRMTVDGAVTYGPEAADGEALSGELTIRANAIDGDVLLAAAAEFVSSGKPRDTSQPESEPEPGPEPESTPEAAQAAATGGLRVDIESGRLALGPLSLTDFRAQAAMRRDALLIETVSVSGFGGTYKGQIDVRLGGHAPSVRWYGELANIDLAKALSALGAADVLTGALSGDVDLTGAGTDFSSALKSARGSARIRISDGVVKQLGIARSVLTAASPRPQETAQNPPGSADTAFTSLSSVLTISGGSASVVELQAASPDMDVRGGGGLRLDGSIITIFAAVQLSPELSRQVATARGRSLPAGARLEVPATIRGSTSRYSTELDLSELTVVR